MRQPSWRQWLVMSVLGAIPVLGCRHADQCDCYSATGPTVYVLPTPQPAVAAVSTKPAYTESADNPTKNETLVQTTAVKKPDLLPGTIAVPMVAGAEGGSKTGTLELTTADAEAMGIRPGYTPGALFLPLK